MYLLEYDLDGVVEKITPEPLSSQIGIRVKTIPVSIERMLEIGTAVEIIEQGITKYKIIKENE